MRFDLVVVGGGHAGCEAAAAAARMGASVALVTLDRRTIGVMPCNPAIGGIGKGHLVAEIDALGGIQGWAADRSGIQFRMLNRSRGPAVWGPRVQCDKGRYATLLRRVVERLPRLNVIDGEVMGLQSRHGRVIGIALASGEVIDAGAVILTTGTFLGGLLHTGEERRPGGRLGERSSTGLGKALEALGFELRRFKTGTPPRLARWSLDLDKLEVQGGDAKPCPFSWRTRSVRNRSACWVTRTPPQVQEIISANLHRSPLFSGVISGVGPRYCPSIEDKVVRFPHHDRHTVFLEPEAVNDDRIYVNGLSTSLPRDVQEQVVHSVPGLHRAEFLQYGYAVEYDVVAPRQVRRDLRSRDIDGLYLAGQILGTSGYEEAAALGLLAGINAVRRLRGEPAVVPGRDEAYLGVLVDDVCGREHREPYRMFTSRAEHRLALGVDSARERLMPLGRELGLVSEAAFHVERERWRRRRRTQAALSAARLNPDANTRRMVREAAGVDFSRPTTWAQILRGHDTDLERMAAWLPNLRDISNEDWQVVVGRLRYDGYLARHERERERLRRLRHVSLPPDLEPARLAGLTREVIEALEREQPRTLAEAEALPGMTPAAMAILAGTVTRQRDPV